MSTTLQRANSRQDAVMFSTGDIANDLSPKFTFKKSDSGGIDVLVVSDIAVFRSGSFRNSWGDLTEFEALHIIQMVANFNALRDSNILRDIPVRDGHPSFSHSGSSKGAGAVIGYHSDLRAETRTSKHDGKEYTYLIAEYEILDKAAQDAIMSGLWRNRSSEVGTYTTNNEASFWPTYMGVAYVDFPAVEGLNGFSKPSDSYTTALIKEDTTMADTTAPVKPQAPTPPAPVAPVAPALPVVPTAADTAAEGTFAAPVAHAAPAAPTHAFTIAGGQVSDFAAVQAHIDSLERFQAETIVARRNDFVSECVAAGRILAPALDSTSAFAQTLSAEQFEAWKATMEAAPASPILGQYGNASGQGQENTAPGVGDNAANEVESLKATIQQHTRSGLKAEKIKVMPSYKRLVALEPGFTL